MKKLLIGLTLLASMPSFAETVCLENIDKKDVCFNIVGSQNSSSLSIMYYEYESGDRDSLSRDNMCKNLLNSHYTSSFFERKLESVDLACVR